MRLKRITTQGFFSASRRSYSLAIANTERRWHFGHVPYLIDDAKLPLGSSDRKEVEDAIARMNQSDVNTVFTPRQNNEPHYLFYTTASGTCSTDIGRISAAGFNTIKCDVASTGFSTWSVVHETLHALGFFHEQSRPDRNNHVTINFANIIQGMQHNFDMADASTVLSIGNYDCESLMHYGPRAFGITVNGVVQTTITVNNPSACPIIGQRTHLSPRDINSINTLYPTKLTTPSSSESSLLGTSLSETEDGWVGTWVRRGSTRIYDAYWTKNNEVERAVVKIDINPTTKKVTVDRINTFYNLGSRTGKGSYWGTLNSAGQISGRYVCDWSTEKPWTATVQM